MKIKMCYVLLTFSVVVSFVTSDKGTLYVGALFELSNHWYANYINFFVTILEDVFKEVDNRTDILADYSLQLITKDTQVMSDVSLFIYLFFTLWEVIDIYKENIYVGLFNRCKFSCAQKYVAGSIK